YIITLNLLFLEYTLFGQSLLLQPQLLVVPLVKLEVNTIVSLPQSHLHNQLFLFLDLPTFLIAVNMPNRLPAILDFLAILEVAISDTISFCTQPQDLLCLCLNKFWSGYLLLHILRRLFS